MATVDEFKKALNTVQAFEDDCPRCVGNFYGDACTCNDVSELQAYQAQKVISEAFESEYDDCENEITQLRAELTEARGVAAKLAGLVTSVHKMTLRDNGNAPIYHSKYVVMNQTAAEVVSEWGGE